MHWFSPSRVFQVLLLYIGSVKSEYLPINWTEATEVGTGSESHKEDPAVTPLVVCTCDITTSFCDYYCCCDLDCTAADQEVFSCVTGDDVENFGRNVDDHSCEYQGPYSPEWHNFLCYTVQNNPYLGLFCRFESAIQDFQKYVLRVKSSVYSYEDTAIHTHDSASHPNYIQGSNVEILLVTDSTVIRDVLSLPQLTLHGICVNTIPIHFLEDFSHTCPLVLSREACENEPKLRTATYLSSYDDELNPDFYMLFPQVISNLTSLEAVNGTVTYKCLFDIEKFIKIQGLPPSAKNVQAQNEDFAEPYSAECDGTSSPFYNESSQMCDNVVLNVTYNMMWQGPSIVEIEAYIEMGSVPVSIEEVNKKNVRDFTAKSNVNTNIRALHKTSPDHKVVLLQHFQVQFQHQGVSAMNNSTLESIQDLNDNTDLINDNVTYTLNITERSGTPGYQQRKPLIGGYTRYDFVTEGNETSTNFLYVDITESTGLYTIQPDGSGSCQQLNLERVSFGVDVISSCLYHWRSSLSCNDLRGQIAEFLESHIQCDVVSKFGSPNVTDEEDFLPLIKDLYGDDSNYTGNSECLLPVSLQYQIVYRDVRTPVTIHAVNQVISIYVRLYYKEMVVDQSAIGGSVFLTTSVIFINSPQTSSISRFWKSNEDRWCTGGTCWREILQPWTHHYYRKSDATTSLFHSAYIINLVVNTAFLIVLVLPIITITLKQKYHLTFR